MKERVLYGTGNFVSSSEQRIAWIRVVVMVGRTTSSRVL